LLPRRHDQAVGMPSHDRKPTTVQSALAPSPPRFSGGEGRGEVVLIKTVAPPARASSHHLAEGRTACAQRTSTLGL
jgi:hypothetical protein